LQPLVQFDGTQTKVYPLQSMNTVTGSPATGYAATTSHWLFIYRAVGTGLGAADGDVLLTVSAAGYTGFGVEIEAIPLSTTWNMVNAAQTEGMAEFMVKIPMGCDPEAWFSMVIGTGTTVTRSILEIRNLPASAASMPLLSKRLYVKRDNGSIDFDATKHRENVARKEKGEEVKCDCSFCVTGKPFPTLETDKYPRLSCELANTSPFEYLPTGLDVVVDEAQEFVVSHAGGKPLFVGPFKEKPETVRPKDKTIRYGDADHPGPPKGTRGDLVKVHHCGRRIQELGGNLGNGKVWLPSSAATRAGFALLARRKFLPAGKDGKNKIQTTQARAKSVTKKPVSRVSSIKSDTRARTSRKRSQGQTRRKPSKKVSTKGVLLSAKSLSKRQKKNRAKRKKVKLASSSTSG